MLGVRSPHGTHGAPGAAPQKPGTSPGTSPGSSPAPSALAPLRDVVYKMCVTGEQAAARSSFVGMDLGAFSEQDVLTVLKKNFVHKNLYMDMENRSGNGCDGTDV